MHIASLADHLDLIDTIVRLHWAEWGQDHPDESVPEWAEIWRRSATRDGIPTAYVALDGTAPCGTAVLVANDMRTHGELSPWLAGVLVAPEHRRRGIASALVRHAVAQAAAMGVTRLYLKTGSARGLYEKLGWCTIADEHYEGKSVTIMAIDINA